MRERREGPPGCRGARSGVRVASSRQEVAVRVRARRGHAPLPVGARKKTEEEAS